MDAQQLLDHIIVPTLKYMGGNYDSKNARMLLLATAAIESKCVYKIKQDYGPALSAWQVEPITHDDTWVNCDALKKPRFKSHILNLTIKKSPLNIHQNLIISPMYACAMARLKYSMDSEPLPNCENMVDIYSYYKKIYNTPLGASTFDKFAAAWANCKLDEVKL